MRFPTGAHCAANQVLYNLAERGIEWRLRALCAQRGMPIMAYSPFAQGALLTNRETWQLIAATLTVTPAQLALAWVLAQPEVIAIPQSSNVAHVDEYRARRRRPSRRRTFAPRSMPRFRRRDSATPLAML